MHSIRLRASACSIAAVLVLSCGRSEDARNTPRAEPLRITIGTFWRGGGPALADLFSREPLVSADWDGRPSFRLARSGEISADGLTISVTLRSGLIFHNGDPVTAERVRVLLVENTPLSSEVDGIAAVDAEKLEIRLKRPHAMKLTDLSRFGIYDDKDLSLRTGPFKIVSVEPTTTTLHAFESYHQGVPTVSTLVVREFATHRAAWTAMMRGEVNFLHEVNRDAIDFVEAGGDMRAYPLLRPYYVPLVFNVRRRPFDSPDVRLALTEAVDRREILENGLQGHGEIADGPFWPHHWATSQAAPRLAANPDAARVRLEAAGLTMRRPANGGMPARFRFSCLLREGDGRFERIALLLQRQFAAIQVDMQLEVLDDQDFLRRVKSGAFDTFLFEFVSGRDLSLPYQFWHSSSSMVPTGYMAADGALDRMKYAQTDDEVRVALGDVMRVFRTNPPAVFLVWPREARAADRSLEIPYTPDRDVFGDLWRAQRAAPSD